ncbi:hypothetical protein [Halomonas sp. C05BenzN]|uniref:hypothetical protein n=1 Tax=Halomonas sp. C05BenzN TaxID=3411041 RepID=UPI003B92F4AB
MSRSLDGLLASHQLAEQRRAAGKPVWDRRLRLKDLLAVSPDATSDERAAWVANRIAERLRRQLPAAWLETGEEMDFELLEVVDGMAALTPSSYDDDEDFSVLEDLNNMLGQLYDWADRRRVWIG